MPPKNTNTGGAGAPRSGNTRGAGTPRSGKPTIFLSYRKEGGIWYAHSIRKELEQYFGKGAIFQDVSSIQSGEEWEKKIPQSVRQAKVFLALIHSDDWFTDTDPLNPYQKARKLEREGDWVRKEIRIALASNCLIIPILYPEVKLWPKDDEGIAQAAPKDIAPFFKKQYEVIYPDKFELSSSGLAKRMKKVVPARPQPSSQPPNKEEEEPYEDPIAHFPLDPQLTDGLCHLDAPYVGFHHFEKKHAPIFFGRGQEIKELFEDQILHLKGRQVLLFYGASGIGKSSLLHAGLFPRLEYLGWYVGYRRRNKKDGLDADLEALKEDALEEKASPKLLLLDQVEEIFTDPGKEGEVEAFFRLLDETLTKHRQLKIVLSFRKEYLADVKDQLKDRNINFLWYSLRTLSEEGVRRAIHGVFQNADLKRQFEGLDSLEPALEEALVKDIMSDEASNIAPLLQYQLRTIWDKAARNRKGGSIILSRLFYQGETSLRDFLEKHKLKKVESQFPEAAKTGLLNDILFFYTTSNLTAASRSQFRYFYRYRHLLEQDRLLLANIQQALIDEYLITCHRKDHNARLAHDALAKIVRRRYLESSAPGQRASAIVTAKENAGSKASAVDFSEADISIIEAGRQGMPTLSRRMEEKIKADKEKYERQRKQRLELALSSATTDIEHLRFERALENLQIAAQEKVAQEKIAALAWQLPFPLNEIGKVALVKECLQFIGDIQPGKTFPLGEKAYAGKGFRENHKNWLSKQNRSLLGEMQKRHFPSMRRIEGGTYKMGSKEGLSDEKPIHKVIISSFQMSDAPITFWQYGLFCLQAGRDIPGDSGFGRGDKPVININWYDALEYCNWLSEWQGLEKVYTIDGENATADWNKTGYRLPTEAEWEYAAREGGKKIRFGNGKDTADPEEMNFDAGHPYNKQWPSDWYVEGRGRGSTTSVKKFAPNALGLYDMSGNVYEWCWDRYDERYYERFNGNLENRIINLLKNILYGEKISRQDPRGPKKGNSRVVRGGSWIETAYACRSTYRLRLHPFNQLNYLGFRVVRRLF